MGKAIESPLTVEQVASLLQTSEKTIYRLLTAGTMRGYKVAASWRVDQDALQDYLDDCRAAQMAKNPVAYVAKSVVYPGPGTSKKGQQRAIQYAPPPSEGYVLKGAPDAT